MSGHTLRLRSANDVIDKWRHVRSFVKYISDDDCDQYTLARWNRKYVFLRFEGRPVIPVLTPTASALAVVSQSVSNRTDRLSSFPAVVVAVAGHWGELVTSSLRSSGTIVPWFIAYVHRTECITRVCTYILCVSSAKMLQLRARMRAMSKENQSVSGFSMRSGRKLSFLFYYLDRHCTKDREVV